MREQNREQSDSAGSAEQLGQQGGSGALQEGPLREQSTAKEPRPEVALDLGPLGNFLLARSATPLRLATVPFASYTGCSADSFKDMRHCIRNAELKKARREACFGVQLCRVTKRQGIIRILDCT